MSTVLLHVYNCRDYVNRQGIWYYLTFKSLFKSDEWLYTFTTDGSVQGLHEQMHELLKTRKGHTRNELMVYN